MMRNSKNLHSPSNLAVNDTEVEDLKPDAANIGRVDNARPERHFTREGQSCLEFRVVAAAQTLLLVLVVSDLLFVLVSRFWV